jgi:hypothetical protein
LRHINIYSALADVFVKKNCRRDARAPTIYATDRIFNQKSAQDAFPSQQVYIIFLAALAKIVIVFFSPTFFNYLTASKILHGNK